MKKKLILIGLLFILAAGFYSRITVREYKLTTSKWDQSQSIRIALIADLHSKPAEKGRKGLAELVAEQKPDFIALAGDIVDDRYPTEGAFDFLDQIKGIAPVFYVTGNHECYREDLAEIKKELEKKRVFVLDDESVTVMIRGSLIQIAGMEDPRAKACDKGKKGDKKKGLVKKGDSTGKQEDVALIEHIFHAEKGAEETYTVLLSHRAELLDLYQKCPADLVLCGHTHGGLVRIPFLMNGLWSIDQGWFAKYAGGVYFHKGVRGEVAQIISRGSSVNLRAPRFFNPPELVMIDIQGTGTAPTIDAIKEKHTKNGN